MKAITNEIGNFSSQVAESLFNQAQSLTFNFLKFSLGLITDTPSLDLPNIQLCLSHHPLTLLGAFPQTMPPQTPPMPSLLSVKSTYTMATWKG